MEQRRRPVDQGPAAGENGNRVMLVVGATDSSRRICWEQSAIRRRQPHKSISIHAKSVFVLYGTCLLSRSLGGSAAFLQIARCLWTHVSKSRTLPSATLSGRHRWSQHGSLGGLRFPPDFHSSRIWEDEWTLCWNLVRPDCCRPLKINIKQQCCGKTTSRLHRRVTAR